MIKFFKKPLRIFIFLYFTIIQLLYLSIAFSQKKIQFRNFVQKHPRERSGIMHFVRFRGDNMADILSFNSGQSLIETRGVGAVLALGHNPPPFAEAISYAAGEILG